MALVYRVIALGEPRGPWRTKKRQAEQDAIAQGLGEVDEWGEFYLDGLASIEWMREAEPMPSGAARPASSTRTRDLQSRSAQLRA